MTFDPVLPLPALGAIALALIALRLIALRLTGGSGKGTKTVLRWGGMTLAILLVLIAAARPGSGTVSEADEAPVTQGANVYFVVDRSADSAIGDFGGAPRMAGIRDDIRALIRSHPDARFAVIAFDSRPAIDWPLSSDAWSLEPVVDALNPAVGTAAGSDQANAGAASNVLRYQLIAAGQQYPRSENLVYYFGSGAAQSSAPQGTFDTDVVDGGAVFGYGAGPELNEEALRGVAEQLGVPYVRRTAGQALPQADATTGQPAVTSQSAPVRVEFYWVFTMLASLLLLLEIYLSGRDLRRSRSTYRDVLS
ncbi:MAG: VWA domain-containing protein [Mycobacterium sp.]